MRRIYRSAALLLAICFLLAMCSSCGAAKPQPVVEEPQAPAAETENAAEPAAGPEETDASPAELYRAAAEKLNASPQAEIRLKLQAGYSAGGFTLEETSIRTVQYTGAGTGKMTAHVSELIILGKERATYDLLYSGGRVYAKLDPARYTSVVTEEEFLAGQIPAVMLDAALYETITAEDTADGTLLRFSGASEGEPWACPEGAELTDAAGTAQLGANGEITAYTYELSYRYGGSELRKAWQVNVDTPENLEIKAEIPESTEGYESLDDVSAAVMLFRAACALEMATAVSADTELYMISDANGLIALYRDEIDWYDDGAYMDKQTLDMYKTLYQTGESDSDRIEYNYRDGRISIAYSEGETESFAYPEDMVRDIDLSTVTQYIPAYYDLRDASVTDLGEFLLVEFSCGDSFADAMKSIASETLYDSADALDGIASGYTLFRMEGYLAVEKDTFLPTAVGHTYRGKHTIDGRNVSTTMTVTMSLGLLQQDTYEDITGDPLPDEEPDEKPTPLFYEVTGDDGGKMYLLGTIHVGDSRTGYLPQVIYDALGSADALAVEFDVDAFYEKVNEDEELQAAVAGAYIYDDGSFISTHLDREVYNDAVLLMKVSGNYGNTAERMKPFVWSSLIEEFYLGQGRRLSSSKGVDSRLMALAREQGIPILDVESGEAQLRMMSEYSDEVQEAMLAEAVSYARSTYLRGIYELYELWCRGDEEELTAQLASMSEEERAEMDPDELAIYDEYNTKMLLDRNRGMAEVACGYLESGDTVFYAVGLAHLLGEGGLLQALSEAGYTVRAVDTHG